MIIGFGVTFEPSDALVWRDRILGRAEVVTEQRCLDGQPLPPRYATRNSGAIACRRYVLAFPLRVTWLDRKWTPWLVRRVARWRDAWFAPMVGPPTHLTTICPHPVDARAVRRIVAAINGTDYAMSQRFDRAHTEPMWTRAAAQPGATIATWAPPYPTVLVHGWRLTITGVVVGDARSRVVTARFTPPLARVGVSVLTFSTTDDEPICAPPAPAPEPHWDRPPASWNAIVALVRARAVDEIGWRIGQLPAGPAAARMPAGRSRVVSVDRRTGAVSAVTVETVQPLDGRWTARFTIDERIPAITGAEFVRSGGQAGGLSDRRGP